ncbi:MAG: LLM class flavin-dependent oxidoreductase [Actinobacteria bacterium]|nr:LLM class flavin-dependent oxidoreductase [Actinomycetota bacterium]
MKHACRIGVQLPEVERLVPWPELIAMAKAAETVGFDSIWLGDHLLYDLPDGSVRGPWEVWTSLAALAAVTERVQLGPLVASIGFHAPAMLAKQAATVDAISGGRLILGLGAGWNDREYRAFGFPFDQRVSRFEEAFGLIRRLLSGETVDHAGRFYEVVGSRIDPLARSVAPPLMIGSTSPRMLSIALPHVQAWNEWWSRYGNTAEGFARKAAQVAEICAQVGRDPAEVQATAAVYVQIAGGSGRTMGSTEKVPPPLRGTQQELAEQLAQFAAVGADHLQLVVDPITQASIEWLGGVLELM